MRIAKIWRQLKFIFYLPDYVRHKYWTTRFWIAAIHQQYAHRKLEWLLKQQPDKKKP